MCNLDLDEGCLVAGAKTKREIIVITHNQWLNFHYFDGTGQLCSEQDKAATPQLQCIAFGIKYLSDMYTIDTTMFVSLNLIKDVHKLRNGTVQFRHEMKWYHTTCELTWAWHNTWSNVIIRDKNNICLCYYLLQITNNKYIF